MKNNPTTLALALATALGTLGASPASALQTTTAAVSFTSSASVIDAEGGSSTSNNGASLGSSSISQFNSSLGVLTGASLNLTSSTQTQTTQVSSTAGGGTGANSNVTSNGTGSSTVDISASGVTNTFSTLSSSALCSGKLKEACTGTSVNTTGSTNWSGAVSTANLNSYVGGGAVTVARTASSLTASQTSAVFNGAETTTSTVTWNGNVDATYTYLLHAAPSFASGSSINTLTLDFGTVNQNASVGSLGFSLYNLLNADRVGLDLDSYSLTAGIDTGALASNLAGFAALGQGNGSSFSATFNTANVGSFSETYTLYLSDADVGASSSRSTYQLSVTLVGNVSPVPEPETWAMLLVGLGLVGLRLRHNETRGGSISL